MFLQTIRTVVHSLGHAVAERAGGVLRLASRKQRKLRVGIDIRPFYEPLTGVGWYLYHLIHEIAKDPQVELILFGDARVTDQGPVLHADLPAGARHVVFDLRGHGISRLSRPVTAAGYVAWMWLLNCDVVFGANYFLPRLMGAIARRRVITVHDLTYKRFPELLQKETLDNLEAHMTREVARADAIIAVSHSTRADLLAYYQVDPRRVVTIHSGIGNLPSPVPFEGLPDRYLLFVSTIEPRKNLGVLLDAYAELRRAGLYEGKLVVAGKIGWKAEKMAARLREPGVVHVDYLAPEKLSTLYRNADAFIFPSIYEGFGFPVLEAMASGVPVVAARSSSLPEVGGEAALYFDPSDAKALTRAITEVVTQPARREELIARGREQAARFRWETAARKTLDVLRAVADAPPATL